MNSKEHILDAKGKMIGRIASEIAVILTGKNMPTYQSNIIAPIKIKIYNTDELRHTGKKSLQKKYYRHSGRIGNLKTETLKNMMQRDSRKVLELAVFGMLPKNRLRQQWMKNISFYKGEIIKSKN